MRTSSALVCGAGIAGSATAYWLHQVGYDVTVVERAPAPRTGGQTVDLRGAGRAVAHRMHVLDEIVARSVDQRGLAFVDDSGRHRAAVPVDAFDGHGPVSEIEILRGDLADVLHASVRDHCAHLWNETVTEIVEHGDQVEVSFETSPDQRFDLVIGADGTHSAVRRAGFGPESAYLRPLGGHQVWFTTPAVPDLDGWFVMHRTPGGRVATLRPGRLPGEAKAALGFRAGPLTVDRQDLTAVRRLVRDRYSGVTGWKVPWLLDVMDTATDLAFDSIAQVRMEGWTRGRVALVGDAAYAPTSITGMGTSLALVGAYVLAGELHRAGHDHVAAFARYEQVLRPYVSQAQQLPPGGMAASAPRSRWAIALGDLSVRSMTRWPMRPLVARFFAGADAIDLPDYTMGSAAATA